jgi:serine/threonine protein kinase
LPRKISKLLGAGGMCEVYPASDEKLKPNNERAKRFELEARAISCLNHPNIVTIYDVGSLEGINYIATELVAGKNLREFIGSGLEMKEILNFIIQIFAALFAAHRAGIIHRDIKPENIMVRPVG